MDKIKQVFFSLVSNYAHVRKATYCSKNYASIICQALVARKGGNGGNGGNGGKERAKGGREGGGERGGRVGGGAGKGRGHLHLVYWT